MDPMDSTGSGRVSVFGEALGNQRFREMDARYMRMLMMYNNGTCIYIYKYTYVCMYVYTPRKFNIAPEKG